MVTSHIDTILHKATEAGKAYTKIPDKEKAIFLRTIADELENLGDVLLQTANAETHLPEARLRAEKKRTIWQLNAFADLLEDGNWINASIDTGHHDRGSSPKPDLRKMLFPIGPVVVFGASNFPFAYSTAGGDTASALAAGCSVIVKCHPAHPNTSKLVANAIETAITKSHMPAHVFQHVTDSSLEAGVALIQHPLTKAGAFTGSLNGGKALFDLANQRKEPIPFFAEMGSTNPVIVLPDAMQNNSSLAAMLSTSITQGMGQFCTQPGLIVVMDCEVLPVFIDQLINEIKNVIPAKMLHTGIAQSFHTIKNKQLSQKGVQTLFEIENNDTSCGTPVIATVSAQDFILNEELKTEVFGPFSLLIKCDTETEVLTVIESLHGQLTGSIFTQNQTASSALIYALQQRCGRLIFNGVPTGVEVNKSMQHGGPFPATTDSRFTSVGVDAIYRFVRPVSFQNFPDELLPAALQNKNPLGIWRCVNNKMTKELIE